MNRSALVSICIAVLALGGLAAVFMQNSSPYLTIKEADQHSGVHVVGKILPGTLVENPMGGEVRFTLTDPTGQMDVVYKGPAQSNLSHATQVVVIGKKDGGTFEANQMLVKCPSKYETQEKPKTSV